MLRIIYVVGSAILGVIGVAGVPDDIEVWRRWLAPMTSEWQWWNYLLTVSGAGMFLHATYPWWRTVPALVMRFGGDKVMEEGADERDAKVEVPKHGFWATLLMRPWELEAKTATHFKLYEAACLLQSAEPSWPPPTDRIDEKYESLVKAVSHLQKEELENWAGEVHLFVINRRVFRKCIRWTWFLNDHRIPWFLLEKFDQVVPEGPEKRRPTRDGDT